jgi:hypothetical protein
MEVDNTVSFDKECPPGQGSKRGPGLECGMAIKAQPPALSLATAPQNPAVSVSACIAAFGPWCRFSAVAEGTRNAVTGPRGLAGIPVSILFVNNLRRTVCQARNHQEERKNASPKEWASNPNPVPNDVAASILTFPASNPSTSPNPDPALNQKHLPFAAKGQRKSPPTLLY